MNQAFIENLSKYNLKPCQIKALSNCIWQETYGDEEDEEWVFECPITKLRIRFWGNKRTKLEDYAAEFARCLTEACPVKCPQW